MSWNIPISGRNPRFQEALTAVKPHILVLNKMELADEKLQTCVEERLVADGNIKRVLYTSCKRNSNNGIRRQVSTKIVLSIILSFVI